MKLFAGKAKGKPDAVFLFFLEGEKNLSTAAREADRLCKGQVKKLLEMGFKAGSRESELVHLPAGRWRMAVMLGLGERKTLDSERFREAVAAGLKRLCKYSLKSVEVEMINAKGTMVIEPEQARAIGEAAFFAGYRYREFKKDDGSFPSELCLFGNEGDISAPVKKAEITGQEHCYVRDLVNKPGADKFPEMLAKEARKAAKEFKLEIKVYDERSLKKMGYNGILRVGQGSSRPPRMVMLRYRGANKPLIGLVGKGVTFDTGGISLKGPEGMERMKDDMTGAAVVLGVIRAAARMKLRQNLVAVIPLAENMPGAAAQRPGDILRMGDGTTVEVISTDAEGRLILADAIHHCRLQKPAKIIDVATLTGACNIALGRFAIGLMGTDEELMTGLSHAGLVAGERCWALPLWDEYKEMIKGEISDLRNVGRGREAGTIIGGMFLKNFARKTPWAHLDIAGTAWAIEPHPYLGKGPTGKGLRLLLRFLEAQT